MKRIEIQLPPVRKVNFGNNTLYTCIIPNSNKKQVYGRTIEDLRKRYEEKLPKGLITLYEDSPFEDLYKNGILLLDSFSTTHNNFSIVLANNIDCIYPIKDIALYQLNDTVLSDWIRDLYKIYSYDTLKHYLDIVERIFKRYDLPITLKPLDNKEAKQLNKEHIHFLHDIETPAYREFLLECKKPCQIILYLYLVLKEIDRTAKICIDDIVSLKVNDIKYGLHIAGIEVPKESIDILKLFAQWEEKKEDEFLFTRISGVPIKTAEVIRIMRTALLVCGLPTNVWIEEHLRIRKTRNIDYIAKLPSFNAYIETLNITEEQKDRLMQYFYLFGYQQSDRKEE